MSLKAKLEAVIYAAEEPVTLAQLAALFAADALEWKAFEEAASADEVAADEVQSLPLVNGEFAYIEQEPVSELIPEPDSAPVLADSLPLELDGVTVELEGISAEQTAATQAEAAPESGGEISPEPDAEAAIEASPAVEHYFAAGGIWPRNPIQPQNPIWQQSSTLPLNPMQLRSPIWAQRQTSRLILKPVRLASPFFPRWRRNLPKARLLLPQRPWPALNPRPGGWLGCATARFAPFSADCSTN
jgi:hypothetical protein